MQLLNFYTENKFMNRKIFCDGIKEFGFDIKEEKINKFDIYSHLLKEWNEKMNLTAITDDDGISIKHFLDCCVAVYLCDKKDNSKIIDIGTGAGFPGIPIKILREDLKVTLVDSLNKRINFLNEVIDKTDLKDVETIHSRAEDLGKNKNYREKYDYVISRAVAPLKILAEYDLPFLKVGGYFIALKAENIDEELADAKSMIGNLGGKTEEIKKVKIPFSDITRSIVIIKKEKSTPSAFPRTAKKIKG